MWLIERPSSRVPCDMIENTSPVHMLLCWREAPNELSVTHKARHKIIAIKNAMTAEKNVDLNFMTMSFGAPTTWTVISSSKLPSLSALRVICRAWYPPTSTRPLDGWTSMNRLNAVSARWIWNTAGMRPWFARTTSYWWDVVVKTVPASRQSSDSWTCGGRPSAQIISGRRVSRPVTSQNTDYTQRPALPLSLSHSLQTKDAHGPKKCCPSPSDLAQPGPKPTTVQPGPARLGPQHNTMTSHMALTYPVTAVRCWCWGSSVTEYQLPDSTCSCTDNLHYTTSLTVARP